MRPGVLPRYTSINYRRVSTPGGDSRPSQVECSCQLHPGWAARPSSHSEVQRRKGRFSVHPLACPPMMMTRPACIHRQSGLLSWTASAATNPPSPDPLIQPYVNTMVP